MSFSSEEDFEDYVDLFEIPIEEIELATNNFADENLLTSGTSYHVYKGQLSQSSGDFIHIVARKSRQVTIVDNEVFVLKDLKHKNIVSVFKCAESHDGKEGIIINKYEANESLNKHISSPTLTWMHRLRICVGVAHALGYLHHDAFKNHYVLHGNIKSSKILLDHNWEPKLHGFAYAVIARKHHIHLTDKYNGSLHYMDPAYEDTRGLNHKSDIFSFGVLLFEVLFGREASTPNDDNWYFARLARSHYEERKLDFLIDTDLRKQMNLQSLNFFAEIAYCCIKEQRSQRPDMHKIRRRLEKAMELQHKYEQSIGAVEDTTPNHLKGQSLDHLRLRLIDIELATDKFSETYCIGSGGYGMVYKAELDYFDGISVPETEGKNGGEFPKKHSSVAIKRLYSRPDKQGEQGFVAEIGTLSNCKHPNIVSLLGFCDEGRELILIYEYAANGSLDDYLGNMDNMIDLVWAQRLQICLDIAHGLKYLHTHMSSKPMIVHRDIKSANILLDDNWVAKIADFGLSKLHCSNWQGTTLVTNNIAGTKVYVDPEYLNTGKLKKESDIYSFGVVLFEILCGRLAYDRIYDENGLPSIARQRFNEGTLMEMVDPKLREADEIVSMLKGGLNQDSLDTFVKIAYQCLSETQFERPTMEVIIKELEKALNFQKSNKNFHVPLEAIKSGTQNFSDHSCVGEGRFWKLHEGEVVHANGCITMFAKRWDSKYHQGRIQFLTELETLLKYKHENIIGLVGYCNEMNENIIVYEHASNGSLAIHLDNPNLTWMKRLKICIDVASGLKFLHESGVEHEDLMTHRDIRSGSILLDGDWNAKISNLEFSCKTVAVAKAEHVDGNSCTWLGYVDPTYENGGFLTRRSDVYSLGVILFEMLCGRLAWAEGCEDHSQSLGPLAVRYYNEEGNLDKMIFEGIKDQIMPESLRTFETTAIQCLRVDRDERPTINELIIQLKKALAFQEDYEIWEHKLPIDYKSIILSSKSPYVYMYKWDNYRRKKYLYDMLCKGILLEDDKVLFSLGGNGERNEMISAKRFSYNNHLLPKWRSLPESRFPKVAEMFYISNLNIQINIRTQFLSPCVNYKVHLIFKFCGSRKSEAKRMYVNLKYKMGNERLNAYFATWREDGWMMIELFQFFNHKKDTDFEVLLESFSRCYCGNDSVYIEGILFQAIGNVKQGEIEKSKEVQQVSKSKSETDKFLPRKMRSAKKIVHNSSNVAIRSRFDMAVELLRKQVFHIKCKISSKMLSANTENVCYLVFKLSEKCCGLQGPVRVRDQFHWSSKEKRILYFRSPNPCNIHETDWIPKKREDGWMEVILWKYNSSNYKLINDHLFVNLKLVTYEGTMSGLIVRGIDFRPI